MGTCGIIKHLSVWRKSLFSPCRKHCPHRCVLLLKTNMFSCFTRHCFIHPSGSGASALHWLLIHHKMLDFAVYFTVDVEQNWISVSGVSFGVSLQLENQSDTLRTYTDAAKKKILWTFSYENTGRSKSLRTIQLKRRLTELPVKLCPPLLLQFSKIPCVRTKSISLSSLCWQKCPAWVSTL